MVSTRKDKAVNNPEQFDVYKRRAAIYNQLVSHEDVEQNLKKLLLDKIDFKNKRVIEAGLGTGRVTQIYINQAQHIHGFDQAQHMLDFAYDSLESLNPEYVSKLYLKQGNHSDILKQSFVADIFIEGWAFGHWFLELYPNYENVLNDYFNQLSTKIVPNGCIVLIETLGTDRTTPFNNSELNIFYNFLETEHQFERFEIRTDYQFESVEQAAESFRAFFGGEITQKIQEQGLTRIPEVTGIWIKSSHPTQ